MFRTPKVKRPKKRAGKSKGKHSSRIRILQSSLSRRRNRRNPMFRAERAKRKSSLLHQLSVFRLPPNQRNPSGSGRRRCHRHCRRLQIRRRRLFHRLLHPRHRMMVFMHQFSVRSIFFKELRWLPKKRKSTESEMKPKVFCQSKLAKQSFNNVFLFLLDDDDCTESKMVADSPTFSHPILDNNSSNHSFFSSGPLPAYSARSTSITEAGCNPCVSLFTVLC